MRNQSMGAAWTPIQTLDEWWTELVIRGNTKVPADAASNARPLI